MQLGDFLVSDVDAEEARPGQVYFAVLESSRYGDGTHAEKVRLKALPPRALAGPANSRPVTLFGVLGAIGTNPTVVKTAMGVVRVVVRPSGKWLAIIADPAEQRRAVALALALETALEQGRQGVADVQ